MVRWKLRIVAIGSGLVAAKRSAELHFSKAEAVAKVVRGAGEFFELFATPRIEQIELFSAMRETAQADSEETDLAAMIAMPPEEILENGEDIGIEAGWFCKSVRARMRVETNVADCQRQCARCKACFAQAFAGFL